MKNKTLWIVVGVLVLLWWLTTRKKIAPAKQAVATTGSAGTAPTSSWAGWASQTIASLTNTTANTNNWQASVNSLVSGAKALFGGSASASSGPASPSTSGNGAGIPMQDDTALYDPTFDWNSDFSGFPSLDQSLGS